MRGWVLLALIGAMACEDTPPAGTRNLLAPSHPVFFEVGGQELLGFIDQGHDAVRLLDLTAGTYQWGTHPYFPRAVRLDDSVIDLAWSGSSLVALSASGQAYEVPAELAAPTSLSLAPLCSRRILWVWSTWAPTGLVWITTARSLRLVAHSPPPSMD